VQKQNEENKGKLKYEPNKHMQTKTGHHYNIVVTNTTCVNFGILALLEPQPKPKPSHGSGRLRLKARLKFFRSPSPRKPSRAGTTLPLALTDRRNLNLTSVAHEYRARVPGPGGELCALPSYTITTQILPQPIAFVYPRNAFQTTNPVILPRRDTILSVAHVKRAVLTSDSKKALSGLWKAGKRKWWNMPSKRRVNWVHITRSGGWGEWARIWACGAYGYCRIPLLEGCVVSARNVVECGIFNHEGVDRLNLW
jgi:hypothetical protein